MSEVFARVAGLIGQVTDVPVEQIGTDSRFDALANWTSYTALRLLTTIEDGLGVRLDLQEYFAIHDVRGLVDAVSVGLGERGAA
ncbi:MAG: acyl carrier protein [Umezawaea sp.]